MPAHLLAHPDAPAIALPDLSWLDEFDWQPRQTNTEYSLGGALLVQTGLKLAGRPVTLAGGDDYAWVRRDVLAALHALLALAAQPMTLTLADGRVLAVLWRGDDPIKARPIVLRRAAFAGHDFYSLTLSLQTAA